MNQIEGSHVGTHNPDRTQLYKDILCTAAEGGIGYWCWFRSADMVAGEYVDDYTALRDCRDAEDRSNKFGDITLDTIALGIQRILSGEVPIASSLVGDIAVGFAQNDAGNIDCWGADAIVQAGLLGDLVYG